FAPPPIRLLSLPCYSPELVENSRRQHLESRLLLLARFCFQHRVIPQARIEKRVASLKVCGMKRVAGVEHDVTPRGQRAREDHYRYVLGRRICFAGQLNLLLRHLSGKRSRIWPISKFEDESPNRTSFRPAMSSSVAAVSSLI